MHIAILDCKNDVFSNYSKRIHGFAFNILASREKSALFYSNGIAILNASCLSDF